MKGGRGSNDACKQSCICISPPSSPPKLTSSKDFKRMLLRIGILLSHVRWTLRGLYIFPSQTNNFFFAWCDDNGGAATLHIADGCRACLTLSFLVSCCSRHARNSSFYYRFDSHRIQIQIAMPFGFRVRWKINNLRFTSRSESGVWCVCQQQRTVSLWSPTCCGYEDCRSRPVIRLLCRLYCQSCSDLSHIFEMTPWIATCCRSLSYQITWRWM